jgi:AAA+ superfamily predicted ATPase
VCARAACAVNDTHTSTRSQIFLERRSDIDVLRNAMVGVFLRKLEYHQGVLFLTTNRVKAFDPAFNSRINVAIRYHDLTKEARGQGTSANQFCVCFPCSAVWTQSLT